MSKAIDDKQSVNLFFDSVEGTESSSETEEVVEAVVEPILDQCGVQQAGQGFWHRNVKALGIVGFPVEVFSRILAFAGLKNVGNFALVNKSWSHSVQCSFNVQVFLKGILVQDLLEEAESFLEQLKPSYISGECGELITDAVQPAKIYEAFAQFIEDYVFSMDISEVSFEQLKEVQKNCDTHASPLFKALISALIFDRILEGFLIQGEIDQHYDDAMLEQLEKIMNPITNNDQLPDLQGNGLLRYTRKFAERIAVKIRGLPNLDKACQFIEKLVDALGGIITMPQGSNITHVLLEKCAQTGQIEKAVDYAQKIADLNQKAKAYEIIVVSTLHVPDPGFDDPEGYATVTLENKTDTIFELYSTTNDDLLKLVILHCIATSVGSPFLFKNSEGLFKKRADFTYPSIESFLDAADSEWANSVIPKSMYASICGKLLELISEEETPNLKSLKVVLKHVLDFGHQPGSYHRGLGRTAQVLRDIMFKMREMENTSDLYQQINGWYGKESAISPNDFIRKNLSLIALENQLAPLLYIVEPLARPAAAEGLNELDGADETEGLY